MHLSQVRAPARNYVAAKVSSHYGLTAPNRAERLRALNAHHAFIYPGDVMVSVNIFFDAFTN